MTTIDDWKDERELLDITDILLEKLDKKELLQMGESQFYNRVLVKYDIFKNRTIITG